MHRSSFGRLFLIELTPTHSLVVLATTTVQQPRPLARRRHSLPPHHTTTTRSQSFVHKFTGNTIKWVTEETTKIVAFEHAQSGKITFAVGESSSGCHTTPTMLTGLGKTRLITLTPNDHILASYTRVSDTVPFKPPASTWVW